MKSTKQIEYYHALKALQEQLSTLSDSLNQVKESILQLKYTNTPPVDPNA